MGSVEANAILASIRSIKKLEEKNGYEYNRIKIRVEDLGSGGYKMIKSIIFRENFMYAVKNYSNLEGYDLLIKKLNRTRNPINFYNLISESDVFSDIFLYYKPGEGLTYGSFRNDQERFNYGLEELGIVDEEKNRLIKKYTKDENEEMLLKVKNISGADDLISFLNENKNRR